MLQPAWHRFASTPGRSARERRAVWPVVALVGVMAFLPLLASAGETRKSAAAPVPHSLVFAYDKVAMFGPLRRPVRILPSEVVPEGAIGEAVRIDFDRRKDGRWMLRLPYDQRNLVPGRQPGHVKVVRQADDEWVTVGAQLLTGDGHHHNVFVPVTEPGVYALVPGTRAVGSAASLVADELRAYRQWIEHAGGKTVHPLTAAQLDAVGTTWGVSVCNVRFVRSALGPKAAGVLGGLLSFFGLEPEGAPAALTFGEVVYLPSDRLLVPGAEDERVDVLVHELWHVTQFRKLGHGYLEQYAAQLVEYGYDAHPLELEANQRAVEGRRAVHALPTGEARSDPKARPSPGAARRKAAGKCPKRPVAAPVP